MTDEIQQLRMQLADHGEHITRLETANERLTAAIQRIDGINDNPANYNVEINAVCDTILRPALKDPTP